MGQGDRGYNPDLPSYLETELIILHMAIPCVEMCPIFSYVLILKLGKYSILTTIVLQILDPEFS